MNLNPFAAVLLSESLLKGNDASLTIGHPHTITVPIKRGDCPGWAGVRITLEAIPSPQDAKESNAKDQRAGDADACETQKPRDAGSAASPC